MPERLPRFIHQKRGRNMMKRCALLMSLALCGFALAFGRNDSSVGGKVDGADTGGNVNTDSEIKDRSTASDSSTVNRVSKPGEYTGYS